jgi:hypothetical protein
MTYYREIETVWADGRVRESAPVPVSREALRSIISSRVRKEFKTVSEFVWAAIVYQIILYSFLTHTLIRRWGDVPIMLLCLAGGALYGLFSFVFLRRATRLFRRSNGAPMTDVLRNVEDAYARLSDFFQFKKRMDWIGIPVSCAIIVLVTFTLFVKGGLEGNPLAGLVVFILWVGMSLIAIYVENARRFVAPLRHLESVLNDLKRS